MEFVTEHQGHREEGGLVWGVESICAALSELGVNVAPSTYCDHRSRVCSKRQRRDEWLETEITRVHKANYGVYGARKVWLALNREGIGVARCTVERLMRELGLQGARRGKVKRTTIPDPTAERPADLVRRGFTSAAPNRLWVADITYVSTWPGWVYVAFVADAYARRILGWRTTTSMSTSLGLDAIKHAIWARESYGWDVKNVVHHADRGSQYTSVAFTDRLEQTGIRPSVGAVGSSYYNALAETINGLYKTEVIKRRGPWHTPEQVKFATAEWSTGTTTDATTSTAATYHPPTSKPPTTINQPGNQPSFHTHNSLQTSRGDSPWTEICCNRLARARG